MIIPRHGRRDHVPIHKRPVYDWPKGKRLAVFFCNNIEFFVFRAGLVGLVMALALSPARAQESTGGRSVHDLFQDCTGSPQSQLSCIRFLGGVASTMMLLGDMADARGVSPGAKAALAAVGACPRASGISGGDMRDAFVRWAEGHPDALMQPEELGAMRALLADWPCR
jgi:hypothetical protein